MYRAFQLRGGYFNQSRSDNKDRIWETAYTYMVIVENLFECFGFTFEANCETISSLESTNDLVAGIRCCTRRSNASSCEPVVRRKVLEKLDCRVEIENDGLICAGNTLGAQCAVGRCVCY